MANPRESKPVLHTKKHIARLERERQQTRLILAGFIAVLVVALGMIIYGYVDLKYLQARRPVARIANVSIPVGEWQARVRMQRTRLVNQLQLYQQYSQYFGMDFSSQEQQILSQLNSTSSMGQTTLDQLIDEELIRQESAKRGLVASTQEVDKSIQASFQFYPSGTPTPSVTPTAVTLPTLSADSLALVTITPTPTVFLTAAASPTSTPNPEKSATPALALSAAPTKTAGPSPTVTSTSTPLPTATPYTLQGFETAYDSSVKQLVAQGLTEAQVHQLYENNVLRQKLFDQITADVPQTQDQVWARHILVASEATAKTVRERLVGGENFAKVAAELSTDTGTKDKGGDLGWFAKGAMVQEFESAAYSLKVGEISQPVKSQFGYHIIQVLAHEGIPLDASGYDQAKQTAFNNWLTKARADYKVVTYDNWQNIVPTDPPAPAAAQ